MKINHWIFHYSWARKIRQNADSPYAFKIETEAIKSYCTHDILNTIEEPWLSLEQLVYRLGVKKIQHLKARTFRDAFKRQLTLSEPVFTDNEAAKIKNKYFKYLFFILLFFVGESFLYYVTASLFIPNATEAAKLVVALVFSTCIVLALSWALGRHFKFQEAKDRFKKKEISANHLASINHWRWIGYCSAVCLVVAVLVAGLSRIYFLENVKLDGLSTERQHSVLLASYWGSRFTLIFTVAASIYMAVLKLQFERAAVQYKTYRTWKTAQVRGNAYARKLSHNAGLVVIHTQQKLEKWWQLQIDIKRILKHKTEHDEQYTPLNSEYLPIRGKVGLKMTDDIYRRFSAISGMYEELFKFGVLNDPAIKEKLLLAKMVQKIVDEYLAENAKSYKNKIPENKPSFSSNGKVKDPSTFIYS